MEQAFRVGIELAVGGDVGKIIARLVADFEKLDRSINGVNKSLGTMRANMRGMAGDAAATARAWRDIAGYAERAARASSGARRGTAGGATREERPSASGALIRNPGQRYTEATQPYRNLPAPVGERARQSGGVYYGEVIPPGAPGGLPATPYGPPFGGQGGGGGRGPGGGAGGERPGAFDYPGFPRFGRGDPFMQGAAAYGGYRLLKSSVMSAAELENQQTLFRARGFSEDQIKKATDEAYSLVGTVAGSTLKGNLELLADLQKVVQAPAEAMALLPTMSRLQVDYDRMGMGSPAEMTAIARIAESRGLFKTKIDERTGEKAVDASKLTDFAEKLLASALTFGIAPEQYLTFMRRAGYSGAALSDEDFFARQASVIQALGASQAGSALAGMSRQMGAGKMSLASAQELIDLGIIHGGGTPKTNPFIKRNGPFNVFVKPGGFDPGMQLMMSEHPEQFVSQVLFPAIDKYLGKMLGKSFTQASPEQRAIYETQLSTQIASSQTGSKEFAESLRLKALIDRDAAAQNEALQRNLGAILKASPLNTFAGLPAAMTALKTSVGTSTTGEVDAVIKNLSEGLNAVAKWARENPTGSKIALEGLATGLGALAIGSTANLALLALGGPGGLLAGLAVGLVALYRGTGALADFLKQKFPDPTTKEGWAQVPGTRLWFQQKAHDLMPGLVSAPHGPLDQGAPNAPIPSGHAPLDVRVLNDVNTRLLNGHDLVHNLSAAQSNQMNLPPSGIGGMDTRQSVGTTPWFGGGP